MALFRIHVWKALAAVIGLALCNTTNAVANGSEDLAAFLGRWQLNPSLTHMGRSGPSGKDIIRSPTFTFVFANSGDSMRMDVYSEYPLAEPTRSMVLVPDGKVRVCTGKNPCLTAGGVQSDQTFAFYEIDNHVISRLFWVKGQIYDYSTMSVSADGKTMTLISWAPQTPQYQNIQVFDKQP